MPLRLRSTFFLSNTGGIANPAGAHLMICVMIDRRSDKAAIVPIVSRRDFTDQACVLNVGDHPFIKHESCASYDQMKFVSIKETDKQILANDLRLQGDISPDILIRLQIGLVTSDEITPWAFNEANGEDLAIWLKHKGHM